jgi:hypothetical protein
MGTSCGNATYYQILDEPRHLCAVVNNFDSIDEDKKFNVKGNANTKPGLLNR